MMYKNSKKSKKGFTLIEALVYVGIATILLGLIVTLYISLLRAQMKQQVIADVETQGNDIVLAITQALRNGQSITAPATTTTGSILRFTTATTTTNPTVFTYTYPNIFQKIGTSATSTMNSRNVVISNVTFTNLSRTSTSGIVRVAVTVTYATSSVSRYATTYSKTFYSSAVVRRILQ